MESSGTFKWVGLAGVATLVAISYGAYSLFSRPSKSKASRATQQTEQAAAAPANEEPLTQRIATGKAPIPKTITAKVEAKVNPNNSDFINQRFPNQVYPEVTMLPDLQRDNPAEYERLLRISNPEYAKILDDNKQAEREREKLAEQQKRELEEQRVRLEQAARRNGNQ